MAELFVRLEFRIFEYFAVGAAYDRLMLDIEYKSGKAKGWEIDAAWNGAYFYGALYFQNRPSRQAVFICSLPCGFL